MTRKIAVVVAGLSLVAFACSASATTPSPSFPAIPAASIPGPSGSTPTAGRSAASSSASPAPSIGFQVSALEMKADPAEMTGVCPVKITFTGRITVTGGGGTVRYQWVSSDGGVSPEESAVFAGPGSSDVSSTWRVNASLPGGRGWSSIEILKPAITVPALRVSPHGDFRVTCDESGFETIGFGLGGSDADCSIATPLRTFGTKDRIRVVSDYSPSLQATTIVTFSLSREGVMVQGYPLKVTLHEATTCLHGNVSPGFLPAGHYRLEIVPDTSRPVAGEFDVR